MTIGGEHRHVSPTDAPMAFDGSVPVSAMPLDGEARDFNLMLREGCSGSLTRRSEAFELSGDHGLLLATRATRITIGEDSWSIGAFDALSIRHARRCRIYASEQLLVAEILLGGPNIENIVVDC